MRRSTRLIVLAVAMVVVFLATTSAADAAFPGGNGDIAFSRAPPGAVRHLDHPSRRYRHGEPHEHAARLEGSAGLQRHRHADRLHALHRGDFGNCDLWSMDVDGANKTRLTFTPAPARGVARAGRPTACGSPSSPTPTPPHDIWVMDADGSNQTRLTSTAGYDRVTPSGRRTARRSRSQSDRAAFDDIWVIDDDGSNPTRLTAGSGETSGPIGPRTGRGSRSLATATSGRWPRTGATRSS